MNRYIITAFFDVRAETSEEAERIVSDAHEVINLTTDTTLWIDEFIPTMKLPSNTMDIHSVLSLLRIRPMDGLEE